MKLLILAGGSGTRLWPLSRASHPKQVQPFLDNRTLLQHTWARLRRGYSPSDIFVATSQAQARVVRKQLPGLLPSHLIVEPVARNTAPAIGLAARVIQKLYPKEPVATINSDHYVAEATAFIKLLKRGERVLARKPEHLILVGLTPTYPETGYGYIKVGRKQAGALFRVAAFKEKPDEATARRYLTQGSYLWNAGLFLFYPETLLSLYRAFAPQLHAGLMNLAIKRQGKAWVASRAAFVKLPSVSIDYAVVEKAHNLSVLKGSFAWADVGHWRTIYDILVPSKGGNVTRGHYLGVASQGNLVYSLGGRLIATVGMKDTIIIDTGDALLVCPRERAQEVRVLVSELSRLGLRRYL